MKDVILHWLKTSTFYSDSVVDITDIKEDENTYTYIIIMNNDNVDKERRDSGSISKTTYNKQVIKLRNMKLDSL